MQLNRAPRRHMRKETQPDAILPELHGNRPGARAALHYGHGKFSASEKMGLFAVGRDQIRLRQNFKQPLAFHIVDEHTQVKVGTKGEDVQQIGELKRVGGTPGRNAAPGKGGRGELFGAQAA